MTNMKGDVMQKQTNIYTLSKNKIAPVLYAYVTWIIDEAQKRDIRTLYFLARDGYVLREIAVRICEQRHIPLECRYLYCSRISLRTPTYHFLGGEAARLIFAPGYHVSLRSIFDRVCLPDDLQSAVLSESGIPLSTDLHAELTDGELAVYQAKLMHSHLFTEHVCSYSKKSYALTLSYFHQKNLFKQEKLAIVDSGWTGSMQRSLRQLLQSAGWFGQIIGFYFGMFATPAPEDGEYLCYYFTSTTHKQNKCLFCNNLFECFLSAPHGMTIGYEQDPYGNIIPVCKNAPGSNQPFIQQQLAGITDGAELLLCENIIIHRRDCEKILRKMMSTPQASIVQLYGDFLFCDDMAETQCQMLVDRYNIDALRRQLIIPKLRTRARHQKQTLLFWDYGALTLITNPIKRLWYWLNIYLWKLVVYSIKRN